MQTHPDNRMVADVLEAEWNAKLRALDEAQRELERRRAEPGQVLDEQQRKRVLALASDFPRLWNDPATPHRERKRMARLLIEDVTLTKDTRSLGVRLRGWRGPSAHLDTGSTYFPALQDQGRGRRRDRQAVERPQRWRGRKDPQRARIPNRTRPRLYLQVGNVNPLEPWSQVALSTAARSRVIAVPRDRGPTCGFARHNHQMA